MNQEECAKFKEEVDAMTFEESMSQLERLVARLEDGGTELDESLEIYEKAVVLRNHCKAVLDDGQRRIRKIIEASGEVTETDFQRSAHQVPEAQALSLRPSACVLAEVCGPEVRIREGQPEGPSEGAVGEVTAVEGSEPLLQSEKQDLHGVMPPSGVPWVFQAFHLLLHLAEQGAFGHRGPARIGHDPVYHGVEVYGQGTRVYEGPEIEVPEVQAEAVAFGHMHQDSERDACFQDRFPDRAAPLLELSDLGPVAVLVHDVIQGVAADAHHLQVAAVGAEQRRRYRPAVKDVQVRVHDPDDLLHLAAAGKLFNGLPHAVLGVALDYRRLV